MWGAPLSKYFHVLPLHFNQLVTYLSLNCVFPHPPKTETPLVFFHLAQLTLSARQATGQGSIAQNK